MNFLKSATFKIILAVAALCIAVGIFFFAVLSEKNTNIGNLENTLSENQVQLDEANEKIAQLESDISKITQDNASTQSELEAAKQNNDKLTQENNSLKQENSTLKKSNEKLTAAYQSKAQSNEANAAAGGQKICYLTFDDGPSDNTLKILEILSKYGAKATFFVTDTNKIHYTKNIHEQGHTVGLHTATHRYSQIYSSPDAYFADLNQISNQVKAHTGVESKIIRFPGGSSNGIGDKYYNGIMPNLIKQVSEKGYFYFDWNVDSCDASGNNVSYTKIRDSVLTSAINKNSICVLMHDTDAKDTTVTALPEIIEGLTGQGYVFKALTAESYGYHHNVN